MKKTKKVFDIVQPKDEWERQYAKLEYLRVGLFMTLWNRIEVEDAAD